MGHLRRVPTVSVIVTFSLLSLQSSSLAEDRLLTRNYLLQGDYSFVLHGTYQGTPYAASGVLTFDGNGKIPDGTATFATQSYYGSFVETLNLVTDQPNTYIVLSDGHGTLRVFFNTSGGFGLACALAITESGRRIYLNAISLRSPIHFEEDIPGPIATGEAAKQQ